MSTAHKPRREDTFVRGAVHFNFPDGSIRTGALWKLGNTQYARVEGIHYRLKQGTYIITSSEHGEPVTQGKEQAISMTPETENTETPSMGHEGDTNYQAQAEHYLRLWVAARTEVERLKVENAALQAQVAQKVSL
jgi:hypothetical protein